MPSVQSSRTMSPLRPSWFARSIVSGFIASASMVLAALAAYVPALVIAGHENAAITVSQRVMWHWFDQLTQSPLLRPTAPSLFTAAALTLTVGTVWALVYARFFESRLPGQGWQRGVLFSLLAWVVSLVALLPAIGAGFYGANFNAGPLPALGSLLVHVVYGAVLGLAYGPAGDLSAADLRGPARGRDAVLANRADRGLAGGVVVGAVIGVVVGIGAPALASFLPATAQLESLFGFSVPAFVVTNMAVGMALGSLVGSWTALAPAGLAEVETEAVEERVPLAPAAPRRQLRVVAVHGVCPHGYRLGDSFACATDGAISPALCPAAAHALQPLVAAMAAGEPYAPRQIACPIYDHMLVFQQEDGNRIPLNAAEPVALRV